MGLPVMAVVVVAITGRCHPVVTYGVAVEWVGIFDWLGWEKSLLRQAVYRAAELCH